MAGENVRTSHSSDERGVSASLPSSDSGETRGSRVGRRTVLGAIAAGSVLGAVGMPSVAADGHLVRADDLVARWPFAEGFGDTVGNADGAAEYGNPSVGTFGGRSGVQFDGDDGMQVGSGSDNPQLSIARRDNGPATVVGWVYFDRSEGGKPNGEEANHHLLRNDAEYVFAGRPDTGDAETVRLSFRTGDLGGGVVYSTEDHVDAELDVSVGEWHHVAVVFDPANAIRIHVDGEVRFSDDEMDGYSPRNTNYWSHQTIGSWYGTGNPDWYGLLVGKLSDLRIYRAELSAGEIDQIRTESEGGDPAYDVSIASTTSPVEAGERLEVSVEVTNAGGATGTTDVTLESTGGSVVDSATFSLDPEETATATLTWETAESDVTDGEIVVRSGSDQASASVRVEEVSDGNDDEADDGGSDDSTDDNGSGDNAAGGEEPTAAFEHAPTSPSVGQQVAFDATESSSPDGEIVEYRWDFGDGGTGEGQTATHTYTESGGFNVTLTVTDDADRASQSADPLEVTGAEDDSDDGTSSVEIPGFGVGTAVSSLVGAGYLMRSRLGPGDGGDNAEGD
ncbi:hypothetical protein DJ71_08700 [Halorubrum sp. E3]|nr:PKD domain-containing protein [Halorubrum persicum]OYR84569.1 hypothetical protein DJ71_08700 [Halorubrum sp. E3]